MVWFGVGIMEYSTERDSNIKKKIYSDSTGQLGHTNRSLSKTAASWKNAGKSIYIKPLFEKKKSFWPLVPNMKWSLLLIYPQSELLCVTSLQRFSCVFRGTKICISGVVLQLHSCLGQFVSSGALHPVLYLIYSVFDCFVLDLGLTGLGLCPRKSVAGSPGTSQVSWVSRWAWHSANLSPKHRDALAFAI